MNFPKRRTSFFEQNELKIEAKAGEGAYSKVYKVRACGSGKYYALKKVAPGMSNPRLTLNN